VPFFVRALFDFARFALSHFRSRNALVAENLFLRKQLVFYQERKRKPHRVNDATRLTMALLSRLFDWKAALVVVEPETLLRWQRASVRLYWRWKSRPGRPKLPIEIRDFIRQASRENPTWGQERIRDELRVKLGISVSARTVRKYMVEPDPRRRTAGSPTWTSFVRNHAQAIVAADFLTVLTARFRVPLRPCDPGHPFAKDPD
jgi:putative transposase